MLYGYVPAVVTGFLLTAIPNWTGRLPLQGTPLIVLLAAWFAGRVAVTVSGTIGWLAAAAIDGGFLLLVAAAAAREIVADGNWSNLKVVVARRPAGDRQHRVSSRSALRRRGRLQHPRSASRPSCC